jgi:hypothetical protein
LQEQANRFTQLFLNLIESYNPLLCVEANSAFLWEAELRPEKVIGVGQPR